MTGEVSSQQRMFSLEKVARVDLGVIFGAKAQPPRTQVCPSHAGNAG